MEVEQKTSGMSN